MTVLVKKWADGRKTIETATRTGPAKRLHRLEKSFNTTIPVNAAYNPHTILSFARINNIIIKDLRRPCV